MNNQTTKSQSFATRTARSNIKLFIWTLAWVGSMVLVDKAILYQWHSSPSLTIAGIVLNAAIGLGLIIVFMKYLKGLDELQRKIQMDALAVSMGVGLVGGFTYSLLVTAGIIVDEEVSDIILLMTITYMLTITFGQVKYR